MWLLLVLKAWLSRNKRFGAAFALPRTTKTLQSATVVVGMRLLGIPPGFDGEVPEPWFQGLTQRWSAGCGSQCWHGRLLRRASAAKAFFLGERFTWVSENFRFRC